MSTLPENAFESYETVQIGEWLVKVSKLYDQIQVFMWNPLICESSIQWFDCEYEAIYFVDYMSAKYV